MFITKRVFDPELEGKAVYLKTNKFDQSGFYLVSYIDNQDMHLVDHTAIVSKFHISFFDVEGNELQVLEVPEGYANLYPKSKLPFDDIEDEPLLDRGQHKTGFTRKQGTKNFRSDIQIKVDNAHLENILRENIDPLRLEEITKRMVEWHGHDHWNAKSASGFVQYAIKCGKQIKKFGYGQYGFDWEAQK